MTAQMSASLTGIQANGHRLQDCLILNVLVDQSRLLQLADIEHGSVSSLRMIV